jgi:hypothetical protein
MIPELNTYIDRCIIDEYAMRTNDGFQLDVDDLPQHEKLTFLTKLLENDTSLRDSALNLMQNLIDERLPNYEAEDLRARGMQRIHLSNGDTRLERQPYASHY